MQLLKMPMRTGNRNKRQEALTVPEILSGTGTASVMGILNVTEDSFSDGGAYGNTGGAVKKALALFEAGASIVDLGAESTRPGAEEVCAEIQKEKLLPVIRGIFEKKPDALLSVDTRNADVALAVLEEGVQIINDVSGLSFHPDMGKVIATCGACAILMHMRGTPSTMREVRFCSYTDVVKEVGDELESIREKALRCGIRSDKLVLDPGVGFGKNALQDWELIRGASALRNRLKVPLLYGVSRKSFLKEVVGEIPPAQRDFATMGVLCALAESGVEIFRVHEVRGACETLKGFSALR